MSKKAIFALTLGAAFAVATPATAATTVSQCQSGVANSPNGCSITFDGTAGNFGNPNVAASPFVDIYNFDVVGAGVLGLTLSSVASSTLSDITFSLVRLDAPGGGMLTMMPTTTGAVEFYQISGQAAVAGQYQLRLQGSVAGAPPSAAYSGTLSFAPRAVPEPATWGMMILGLGMMGGVLRRRKTRVAFA